MACLQKDNVVLKQKLIESENDSKKNNLFVFDILETHGENNDILLDKMGNLLDYMEIDLRRIKVDNIHRLPSATSPKPIIVKLCSFLDRNQIGTNRSRLAGHQPRVIIREHFVKETDANIKTLLPIN